MTTNQPTHLTPTLTQMVFYDGATGQCEAEVADAHGGSIYSVCFSPDGTKVATASADRTVKVITRRGMCV